MSLIYLTDLRLLLLSFIISDEILPTFCKKHSVILMKYSILITWNEDGEKMAISICIYYMTKQ